MNFSLKIINYFISDRSFLVRNNFYWSKRIIPKNSYARPYFLSTFRKSFRNPELDSLTNVTFTLFLVSTPCTGDGKPLQSLLCPDIWSSSSFSIFNTLFCPQFATLPVMVDALLVTGTLEQVKILELLTTCTFIWDDFGKIEDREPGGRVRLPLLNGFAVREFCATVIDGVILFLQTEFGTLWPEGAIINKLLPFLSHTMWEIVCCNCFWLVKLGLYAWFSFICFSCFKYTADFPWWLVEFWPFRLGSHFILTSCCIPSFRSCAFCHSKTLLSSCMYLVNTEFLESFARKYHFETKIKIN